MGSTFPIGGSISALLNRETQRLVSRKVRPDFSWHNWHRFRVGLLSVGCQSTLSSVTLGAVIHPFREGNADIMALQAGFPVPEYGFVGKGAASRQQRYLTGVQRGYIGH